MGAGRSVIIFINYIAPLLMLPIRRITGPLVRVKEQIEYFREEASWIANGAIRNAKSGKPYFLQGRRNARKAYYRMATPEGDFLRILEYFLKVAIRTQTRGPDIREISPSVASDCDFLLQLERW